MGQFRYTVWDPWMISAQIITLQTVFYLFLGAWVLGLDILLGSPYSLDQLFSYKELVGNHSGGKLLIAAFICNSLTCSLGLWYIVQRTKLCLDFSCTVHLLHLLVCLWWNTALPATLTWWVINLVCAALMCVTGEFLCMRTELRTIPVNMAGGATAQQPKTDHLWWGTWLCCSDVQRCVQNHTERVQQKVANLEIGSAKRGWS